jgi:hypothetical protein
VNSTLDATVGVDRTAARLIEVTVGGVVSTVKVALGPAAGAPLLARSLAVPAAIEMPTCQPR